MRNRNRVAVTFIYYALVAKLSGYSYFSFATIVLKELSIRALCRSGETGAGNIPGGPGMTAILPGWQVGGADILERAIEQRLMFL
jgi:hypothetical protein